MPPVTHTLRVTVHPDHARDFERLQLQAVAIGAPRASDERIAALEALVRHDTESSVIACRRCLDHYGKLDPRHWRDVFDLWRAERYLAKLDREAAG